jgi:hypothetical protein
MTRAGSTATTLDTAEEITQDQALTMFDSACQYFLQMSGPEFLDAWSDGKFENDDRPGVMEVVSLIPLLAA